MEPDLREEAAGAQPAIEPHIMDPLAVIRMATALQVKLPRLMVVGCEPETLGEEGHMGLSRRVEASLDEAIRLIENLIVQLLEGTS